MSIVLRMTELRYTAPRHWAKEQLASLQDCLYMPSLNVVYRLHSSDSNRDSPNGSLRLATMVARAAEVTVVGRALLFAVGRANA